MIFLKIQNLILIEKAEIHFGPGLNIITGETGAGKSAILSAIQLIRGDRADSQCIRKGTDFAIVEAQIGDVHIRREIHRSGKNRCFIDEAQVSVADLKLRKDFEMVDQSSSVSLNSAEEQLFMLDTFAKLLPEVEALATSSKQEKEWEKFLSEHNEEELKKMQEDLNWFQEVHLQPGEEEQLAKEHHLLAHGQEILEKVGQVSQTFSESTLLSTLKKAYSSLDQCVKFDANLVPLVASIKNATLELEDSARTLQKYCDRLEVDPQRLLFVEKRIGAIEGLKRRFGPHLEKVEKELNEKILALDTKIQTITNSLEALKKKNQALANEIDQKRKQASLPFAKLILEELKTLNIPHAKFEIGPRFEFLFSANQGQKPIPIEECASGGELSRLLLALKVILGSGQSCLVFDEIDSNVGGQTAAILGEKLKRLAENRPLICVTHFVQVAKWAMDHFLVTKVEKEENTYTKIEKLDLKRKESEYQRMLGAKV